MGKKLTLGRALDDGQWALMLARAPVGYIYAVTTTGICCRPGCPARTPNRQNVSLNNDGPVTIWMDTDTL